MQTARLVGAWVVSSVLGASPVLAGDARVAVAANFTNAVGDIVPLFEKATGHTVKVSFGSTGKLYSQIENGAPFEVFLAADTETPLKAVNAGLAVPGTRFTYAKGKLVMWSAKAGAFENGEDYVKAVAFRRAAIANPKTAPYGRAARQVMEQLGVWQRAQPRLVLGDNVTQAFQFAATGNAEAAFVAYSQIEARPGEPGSLWEIPESYYAPVAQQAVLLRKGEKNEAARAFLEFLETPRARKIIASYGYAVGFGDGAPAESPARTMSFDWQPVALTLKLATVATACLLMIGTPIAWWLARTRHWLKQPVASVIALPLVLPPTVLGFYLLVLLGPNGPVGELTQASGFGTLPFTFQGLVVGSVIYSLPFAIQPLHNAFEAIGERPLEVAATLRAPPWDRFWSIAVPLARPGFLTATVLAFAHTIGEFGVVLMLGGNIPGETKVLSVAVYDHVEALEYGQAHWLAGGMIAFSFAVLLTLYLATGRQGRVFKS